MYHSFGASSFSLLAQGQLLMKAEVLFHVD